MNSGPFDTNKMKSSTSGVRLEDSHTTAGLYPLEMNHFQRDGTLRQRLKDISRVSMFLPFLFHMAPAAETHQNCLSICQVEGGLEGSKETGRDDVLVDKVGETHHAVFPSCTTGRVRTGDTLLHAGSHAGSLTPQLHQFGQDDETGLLADGVRDVHRTLDDGEHNSLHIFCT